MVVMEKSGGLAVSRRWLTSAAAVAAILRTPVALAKGEPAVADDLTPGWDFNDEIAALIRGEDEAWNNGDAKAFAARVLPNVIFTNVLGMFSVGKAPFLAQHERIFATIYKGSTNHQEIKHISYVRPDVAIVDTLSIGTNIRQPPPGVQFIDGAIHARLEQVLVREPDGWWVASFHNVAVNPAILSAPR